MGDWTGTVPSHASGAKSKASKLQTLDDIATALTAAWTTWTPTLTNLTTGNGSLTALYRRLGKTLDFDFHFTLGSTSAVGTGPKFTLPYTPASRYTASNYQHQLADGMIIDASAGASRKVIGFWVTSGIEIWFYNATPTHVIAAATAPWTWTTSDLFHLTGTVELP